MLVYCNCMMLVSVSVAPRLPDVGEDCSACLSCGMVVLLIIAGCRLFHRLMVLGKKDDLYTSVQAYDRL